MEVILWWKSSSDEIYLVMKVEIVKEVMACDVSPVAIFLSNAILEVTREKEKVPKTRKKENSRIYLFGWPRRPE